jgi:hypothetical protein
VDLKQKGGLGIVAEVLYVYDDGVHDDKAMGPQIVPNSSRITYFSHLPY